jgi:excisionase family DNA binding protein
LPYNIPYEQEQEKIMANEQAKPRLKSIRAAATELGLQEITLRQWICERRIASTKIGGRRLIPVEEIERLINENYAPALPTQPTR